MSAKCIGCINIYKAYNKGPRVQIISASIDKLSHFWELFLLSRKVIFMAQKKMYLSTLHNFSYIWELIAVPDTTVLYWQSDGNHAASGSKTIREVKWASMVLRLECSLLEITQILKSLIWVLFFNFKYFCRIKAFK